MKPANIPRTSIRIGVGLQSVAVLVLVVLANFLAFQRYERRDFSRSQKFALSAQTRQILREFKKPVQIFVISSPTLNSPVALIAADIRGLFNEIQFSGRDRVRIEHVNPVSDLTRTRELQGQYKFGNADGVVVLEYDGRTRILNMAEMADFDFSALARGGAPKLLAFRGEQALAGAMLSLVRPDEHVIYFLQGHGEPGFGKGSPVSVLADYVSRQHAKTSLLSLASSDAIPTDAGAIAIIAPKFDLEEREALLLGAWLRSRGRILVLLDPNAKTPRLAKLLEASGISPRNDRVLRTIRLSFATGILRDVTGIVLPTTEMTRRMTGTTVLFPGSTQSLALDKTLATKEKIQLRPLVEAGEEFWGETDYAPNKPDGVRYEDGIDNGQPLTIAASADRDGIEDDRLAVQTSRLIVFGSSQFAFDASLSPQAIDLLLGCFNALLDRDKLTGVTAKSAAHFNLNLTDHQLGRLAMVTMLAIPGAVAFWGILVWWRRRS